MSDSEAGRAVYDAASYASVNPEASIYQDDARIFHRDGSTYLVAESFDRLRVDAGRATMDLRLSDGSAAKLAILAYAPDVLRLRMWRENADFETPSNALLPVRGTPAELSVESRTADEVLLTFGDYRIELTSEPVAIRIERDGRRLWATETETLAGDYHAPGLGFRLPADGAAPTSSFLSWRIANDERFFGLGEKWNACEKSSTRATIWASDTCGSNTTDLAYKSLPLLLSSRGVGVMLHTGHRSYWEVGTWSYTAVSALTEQPQLDLFLMLRPSPAELIGKYTELTGRASMPPRWFFGTWMSRCQYENQSEAEAAMDGLREHDIPADVIHLDPLWMRKHWYFEIGVDACDFHRNERAFPDLPGLWRKWRDNGFATSLWINPYLPEGTDTYEEAERGGYMLRSTKGGLARLSHGEPVGMVDFSNPDAVEWWKGKLKQQLRDGAMALKPDYGDRVPEDALFHNGRTGAEMHNIYMHLYAKACYEATEEVHGVGYVWRRSGYLGSQRYPGCWAGDTQTTWEAFRCCLRGGLNAGLSGEPFWASDIGGFTGEQPSPELYIRWVQVGFLSGLTRFHGASGPREPWAFGEQAVEITRYYAKLRYRLMPYILAAAHTACRTGLPLMRHLALACPDEPNVHTLDDQYLFGPDLLCAPVLQPGATERWVYFPAGRWHRHDGEHVIEGPGFHRVPAPLKRMPLYVRDGAAIPQYEQAPAHLKGPSPKRMLLHTWGRADDQTIEIPESDYRLTIALRDGELVRRTPADVEIERRPQTAP